MCGTLLHGDVHLNNSACTNKKHGPPIDRDGNRLRKTDGAPSTEEQPPCLLRSHTRLSCAAYPERHTFNKQNVQVLSKSLCKGGA